MDEQAPVNPATLERLRAIQRPGAPNLLDRVIRLYEKESAELIGKLRGFVEQNAAKEVRETAHRFKSVSGNVGAERLAADCSALERRGRDGDLSDAAELLAAMEEEHRRVSRALASERSGFSSS